MDCKLFPSGGSHLNRTNCFATNCCHKSGSNSAGATGQGLAFYASFISAYMYFITQIYLNKINIGSRWLIEFMKSYKAPPIIHRHVLYILHKTDHMRNTGVHATYLGLFFVKQNLLFHKNIFRRSQFNFDRTTDYFCFNKTSHRLEFHFLRSYVFTISVTSCAASTIATHLGSTAIRIIKLPAKVSSC